MGGHGYSNYNTGVKRDPQGNVIYDPNDPNSGVPYGDGGGYDGGGSVDETGEFTTPLRRN